MLNLKGQKLSCRSLQTAYRILYRMRSLLCYRRVSFIRWFHRSLWEYIECRRNCPWRSELRLFCSSSYESPLRSTLRCYSLPDANWKIRVLSVYSRRKRQGWGFEIHEWRSHKFWRYRCRWHWSCGRHRSLFCKSIGPAQDLGNKLVKSISGEIKYLDQNEVHHQRAKYFYQLAKFNKECFARDYDWYVQKGLII